MFIFNKYITSFNFKNRLLKNESSYINYNFNYKNNVIHSVLFMFSLNFYFYLYNSVIFKNSFKSFMVFNPFLLFFLSKKSTQKVTHF